MTLTLRRPIVYVPAAALVLALLVIARPVLNPPAIPTQQSSNPAATRTGPLPVVPVVDLDLDRLRTADRELPESARDPFRFRPKPPPPVQRVQAPPPVFAPPVPTGPPPVPEIPLRVFGISFVQDASGRRGGQYIASFRDERGNTFTGKEGDLLEGRYRLLRIGPDGVDVAYLDGRGRQTIRLTGQ
jgi:hypothetical protein